MTILRLGLLGVVGSLDVLGNLLRIATLAQGGAQILDQSAALVRVHLLALTQELACPVFPVNVQLTGLLQPRQLGEQRATLIIVLPASHSQGCLPTLGAGGPGLASGLLRLLLTLHLGVGIIRAQLVNTLAALVDSLVKVVDGLIHGSEEVAHVRLAHAVEALLRRLAIGTHSTLHVITDQCGQGVDVLRVGDLRDLPVRVVLGGNQRGDCLMAGIGILRIIQPVGGQ